MMVLTANILAIGDVFKREERPSTGSYSVLRESLGEPMRRSEVEDGEIFAGGVCAPRLGYWAEEGGAGQVAC